MYITIRTLALFLTAALTLPVPTDLSAQRTAESFAWSGSLPTGGSVEVKGVNGPIRAVPSSDGTVRVIAERHARRSDPSDVRIEVVEHAGGVTVCAVYPSSRLFGTNECLPGDAGRLSARNNDTAVTFTVEVPLGADFIARTSNGQVTATGLTGNVHTRTTNGNVTVEGGHAITARTTNGSISLHATGSATARSTNGPITARVETPGGGVLDFSTTNGNIRIALPAAANFELDAVTTNGRIRSDLPITTTTTSRNRLKGTLGSGGDTLTLRTTNGSIRIDRID